jgi:hypothetical protein
MFQAFFSPFSEAGVQLRQQFKSPGYGVGARALTPYPADLNHCRISTPEGKRKQQFVLPDTTCVCDTDKDDNIKA